MCDVLSRFEVNACCSYSLRLTPTLSSRESGLFLMALPGCSRMTIGSIRGLSRQKFSTRVFAVVAWLGPSSVLLLLFAPYSLLLAPHSCSQVDIFRRSAWPDTRFQLYPDGRQLREQGVRSNEQGARITHAKRARWAGRTGRTANKLWDAPGAPAGRTLGLLPSVDPANFSPCPCVTPS